MNKSYASYRIFFCLFFIIFTKFNIQASEKKSNFLKYISSMNSSNKEINKVLKDLNYRFGLEYSVQNIVIFFFDNIDEFAIESNQNNFKKIDLLLEIIDSDPYRNDLSLILDKVLVKIDDFSYLCLLKRMFQKSSCFRKTAKLTNNYNFIHVLFNGLFKKFVDNRNRFDLFRIFVEYSYANHESIDADVVIKKMPDHIKLIIINIIKEKQNKWNGRKNSAYALLMLQRRKNINDGGFIGILPKDIVIKIINSCIFCSEEV